MHGFFAGEAMDVFPAGGEGRWGCPNTHPVLLRVHVLLLLRLLKAAVQLSVVGGLTSIVLLFCVIHVGFGEEATRKKTQC